MLSLNLRIEGDTILVNGLDSIGKKVMEVGKREIRSALIRAREVSRTYPPHANKKYRRTKTYHKGFKVEKISGEEGWSLTNSATDAKGRYYTTFVGGDEEGMGQAWNNKHWPVVRKAVDAEARGLVTILEMAMSAEVAAIYAGGGP